MTLVFGKFVIGVAKTYGRLHGTVECEGEGQKTGRELSRSIADVASVMDKLLVCFGLLLQVMLGAETVNGFNQLWHERCHVDAGCLLLVVGKFIDHGSGEQKSV